VPMMRFVPCLLILSICSSAAASAQSGSVTPAVDAARWEPTPSAPGASTNLADSATRQARKLVVNETVWKPVNRARSQAPREGEAIAFALGATAGALLGFGIAGQHCHCESSGGALFGAAVGGIGGVLLFRALTK